MPSHRFERRSASPAAASRLVLDLHASFVDLPVEGLAVQAGDVLGLDGLLETIVVAPCDGLVYQSAGMILLTPLCSRTAARA